ncbi:Translation initiation factor SUI1-related protein [Geitlerinema sp. FC II]|uniref:translation initiation factor n=1 Tax=Baaleninema simplex TaxID=2862350 RepID=UPI00034CFEE5|nr:translation initiation factor [Baaleninema simplex]PPT05166.1 Translation initiation factor SUI1-related protein [Geitlerinema sp. FC II]
MSKHKSNRDRLVYSEFGNDATAREPERVQELPPQQQDLRVQATRKGRKGKTVTIVTGFQAKPETLKALSKALKSQCGAGGAVKDNAIEIQGEFVDRVVAFLKEKGYPAKRSGG